MRLILLTRRADNLDDVWLTARKRSGLVEGQSAQPADLLEEFTAAY
jgi:hypothetical protein